MGLRLPRSVKMGHATIKIVETAELEPGDLGVFVPGALVIFIRTGLGRPEQLNTLMHELAHAIWNMDSVGEKPSEERVVSCMGNRLAEVFLRNRTLRAYVAGEE